MTGFTPRTHMQERANQRPARGVVRVFRSVVITFITTAVVIIPTAAHAAPGASWRSVRLEPTQIEAAGTTFAYAELGSGPPLLLLNGTGSPMAEWDPALLAGLASRHQVIVFDYPGLGLSGPAPGRWTFAGAADWIAEFMKALHPSQAIDVLGWSMGGFIAQQLAIRHPSQVHRLVLAATNPGGSRAVLGPRWVQEADSDPDASIDTYLLSNYPHDPRSQQAGSAFIARLTTMVDSGAYPEEDVPTSTYEAMVAAEDAWLGSDANSKALSALRIPTLVTTGTRDVVTPPTNSRRIAAAIPGSRFLFFAGSGHSFLFQFPDRVAGQINGFLAG